jgi:hypothetical protein
MKWTLVLHHLFELSIWYGLVVFPRVEGMPPQKLSCPEEQPLFAKALAEQDWI